MIKEIWKWVLNQQEEQKLSEIVNTIKVEIPGFRKGSKLPPKQIMIMQLLKPKYLQRMDNTSISLSKELEEAYDLLTMSDQELNSITNIPPSLILLKLLSEKEEDKAISLYHCWKNEHGEEGLRKLEEERQTAMEEWLTSIKEVNQENGSSIGTSSIELKKWEKKQKRLEQKLKTLQEELEQLQLKYKTYQEDQEEKEREGKNEYQQLKMEYIQIQQEHQNNILLYEVEKQEWQNEKLILLNQVEMFQKEIRQMEVNLLNMKSKEEDEQDKRKIYLLGNPHNQSIFLDCPFEVTIVERSEIDQVDFADCQEIWGLTYKLDSQIIKNIQKKIDKPIKKIGTFKQLKQELEKGREDFEKQKVGS